MGRPVPRGGGTKKPGNPGGRLSGTAVSRVNSRNARAPGNALHSGTTRDLKDSGTVRASQGRPSEERLGERRAVFDINQN